MKLITEVQNALLYYTVSQEDGPVGFVATDSGKIAVRFRMSTNIKVCDNLLTAFDYILKYKTEQ